MQAVWSTYHVVLLGTLAALPLAVLVVALRYRMLRHRPGAARDAIAEVAAGYGTLPWLLMTMTPDPGAANRVNLVPLRDLAALAGAPTSTIIVQIVGNLLVFAAAGFFLPVRTAAFASLRRILAFGVAGSALIETAQYLLRLGRVSSVDDVLVNTLGAVLFALASRPWWKPIDRAAGPQRVREHA
jgi:hypothetical protein